MALDREQTRRLKAILGRPVPRDYATALRNLPKGFEALRDKGLAADELPLFLDGDVIVQQNELVREEDIWTEEGPWPADHLLIGAEISGDKFSLCVSDKQIYRLLHASAELVPLGSLPSYLRALGPFAKGKMPLGEALAKLGTKTKSPKRRASKEAAKPAAKKAGGEDKRIASLQRKVERAKSDWDRSYALWDLAEAYEKAGRLGEALACHDEVIALGAVAAIRYDRKITVLSKARYDWKRECPAYRAAFRELFGSSLGYYEELIAAYDGFIAALKAAGDRASDLKEAQGRRKDVVAESKDRSSAW